MSSFLLLSCLPLLCSIVLLVGSDCTSKKFLILHDFQHCAGLECVDRSSYARAVSKIFDYAKFHGYQYRSLIVNDICFSQRSHLHFSWRKVFTLFSLLSEDTHDTKNSFDYVVYFDSSSYFIENSTVPLCDLLGQSNQLADIYLDQGEAERVEDEREDIVSKFSAGFQIWKNSEKNKELLYQWLFSTKTIHSLKEFAVSYPFEAATLFPVIEEVSKVSHSIQLLTLPSGRDKTRKDGSPSNNPFISRILFESLSSLSLDEVETDDYQLDSESTSTSDTYNIPERAYRLFDIYPDSSFNVTIPLTKLNGQSTGYTFYTHFEHYDPSVAVIPLSYLNDAINCQEEYDENACYEILNLPSLAENLREKQILEYREQLLLLEYDTLKVKSKELLQSSENYEFSPRAIVTIVVEHSFGLNISMKYWITAIEANIIQEIHLWDYCQKDKCRQLLLSFVNPSKGIFIRTRFTVRYGLMDFYDYYIEHGQDHPNDVLIKSNENIIFIDIFKLSYFISVLQGTDEIEEPELILFANIVNNDITAYYQQELWNILPKRGLSELHDQQYDEWNGQFIYPETEVSQRATSFVGKSATIHRYFIQNWESIIRPSSAFVTVPSSSSSTSSLPFPVRQTNDFKVLRNFQFLRQKQKPSSLFLDPVYYLPENVTLSAEFSTDFFGMQASSWAKLVPEVGRDDSYHLTVTLRKVGILKNSLLSNFLVSQLSSTWIESQEDEVTANEILKQYEKIYEKYMEKHLNDIFTSEIIT
jgi:hypothetical protein